MASSFIIITGSATGMDARGRPLTERPDEAPAIVRGLLTLKLTKFSRIRRIEVKLEGKARTEWPEGIGPRRTETSEENVFISETLTFFTAAQSHSRSRDRRAVSLGPGGRIDEDWEIHEGDEFSDGEGHAEDDGVARGRAGRSGHADIEERGRGPIARVQPRSYSAMPEGQRPPLNHTQTQPPTRRQSFDRDITSALNTPMEEGPGAALGESLRRVSVGDYTTNTPRQPARNEDLFRQRGPSPAYSVRDPLRSSSAFHPRTSSLRREAETPESSPRSSGGYQYSSEEADLAEGSLSPIASVDASAESSRYTSPNRQFALNSTVSPGTDVGAIHSELQQSPVHHRTPSDSAPPFGNEPQHSLNTPRGSISTLPEGSPRSSLENRQSISSRSEQNYISVTRPGSRQSSLVEQIPSPQLSPVLGPQTQRGRASREGSMSSLMRPPALSLGIRRRPSGSHLGLNVQSATASQISIPGHGLQDPAASSSSSLTAASQAGDRGRKPGKFSFAAVTSTLRNLSKGGLSSRSRSRAAQSSSGLGRQSSHDPPVPPLPREASVIADGRLRRLADEDEEFRPFGRGGAGRSPSRSGRGTSATRSKDERSESRSRGRHIGLKVLTGALKGEDWDDGEGVHNWKEFRKGTGISPTVEG
jgi:hypothetical protein